MTIRSTFGWRGHVLPVKYYDLDSFDSLPYDKCQQVYGVCFHKNKMVIVLGEGTNGSWGLVGGHIEPGETFEQTLNREVLEETNMMVVKSAPVGVQEVTTPDGKFVYQLRYFAVVEPLGKFEKDPAGNVTEIKLINPKDYKKYFDWGEVGDRIIERSMIIKSKNIFKIMDFISVPKGDLHVHLSGSLRFTDITYLYSLMGLDPTDLISLGGKTDFFDENLWKVLYTVPHE